jgi:DNA polymerase delta subunit 1
MVLDTCTPIVGAHVMSFEREDKLLAAWSDFVRRSDPDIITGYNVQNFDMPYLVDRAAKLNVGDFTLLGRVKTERATVRDTKFSNAAFGKMENKETSLSGRIMFDCLQYMRRNHKLSSYSLNAVCAEFLKEQKEDVHHSIISDLQMGTPDDRRRLAVYCLKDAYLPQRLLDKLMVIINHVEMARVTGVPLDFLLTRGQQIKVMSMICRKCRRENLLVPTPSRKEEAAQFEGATVIEPIKGFYSDPIATLDFASLYPSIMMAHNLCYSTLVEDRRILSQLPDEAYQRSPTGAVFVKNDTKPGILPRILKELLDARKRAKKDMKAATDPMVKAVQNGRQLALKISANSVYGFTGATVGQLPCLDISSSVTAYGRDMIHATKKAVEETYTVANGYPADAVVVYGDTDSVMVKFGVKDVGEAMKLGHEAADAVTKLFPPPVRLEFEKVYWPYLLMNKKRYAGQYWTRPEKPDKLDAKGIETVRRDNCALVRQVVDTCLRMIIMNSDVKGAVAYAKQIVADLLQNKVDISLLVITKALAKGTDDSAYKAKQAHVELAKRLTKRDPGNAPQVGDRIPYVIIQKGKGAPAYERSEDPIYVLENSLPIDTRYYLENQLQKPLDRIFSPILSNTSSLFAGDHALSVKKVTRASGGLMMFAVKTFKCMACKAPLKKGRKTLCEHCTHKAPSIYQEKLLAVTHHEDRFSKLWTQCQRCQGSLHQDVLCTSRDCPIFYMRRKVQMELKEATDTLARFEEDLSF